MAIPLPYSFQNLDTSQLSDAKDSAQDVIGKAVPGSYLDACLQQLAKLVTVSDTAPIPEYVGQFWRDTSVSPPVLKQWDGFTWSTCGYVTIPTAQDITGAKTFKATLTMSGADIVMAGNETVDGVDVSAHAGGTAKAQHAGGLGTHTHQSDGVEGGKFDSISGIFTKYYNSGWVAVSNGSKYSMTHNLGVIPIAFWIWFSPNNGTTVFPITQYTDNDPEGGTVVTNVTTTSYVIRTAEDYSYKVRRTRLDDGSIGDIAYTSGYVRVIFIG
jgi:hypothetical protein